MRDRDSFEALAHIHSIIDERWRKHPVSNDPGRQELYLAIDFKSELQQNYYYFAEHDAQDIFWLEELHLDSIIGNNWQTLGNYGLSAVFKFMFKFLTVGDQSYLSCGTTTAISKIFRAIITCQRTQLSSSGAP